MFDLFEKASPLDRRRFVEYAAKACLGVGVMSQTRTNLFAADAPPAPVVGAGKAKKLIYLYMAGAMSHIDTFDLKPGHKHQGQTQPIATNVPGAQLSQYLPTLAGQFDKLAVVRSLSTLTADHEAAEYWMRTSYQPIATERHPTLGPWVQKFRGRQNKSMPDSVLISAPSRHPSAGFFDPSFSPLPIGDPNRGLENTKAPDYLSDSSFDKRLQLIDGFDQKFRSKYAVKKVKEYTDFYTEAVSLLSSKELKAFDLNEEKPETRDRYGRDTFGQGCLLARRLVENNVPCVEVSCYGWDMHANIFNDNALPSRCRTMDQAVGNLLKDLQERGLLDETIVVLTTEFGRTPDLNYNVGRDHHPAAFSSMLAGGGIRGGQFYGKSDAGAVNVESDGVAPADLNATVATALGLPVGQVVHSPTGRPFKVAHDGKPILKLFS